MSRRLAPSPIPIILIVVAWLSQETEQRTVWILRAAGTVIVSPLLQANKSESARRLQVYLLTPWNLGLNLNRLTAY